VYSICKTKNALVPFLTPARKILLPLAAIVVGSGTSLVWAEAGSPGAGQTVGIEKAVARALGQRLPRTPVTRINCTLVDGLCEVTAGSQLFYVDRSARYLLIGRVYDMETRRDLTAARLLEVNPDLLLGGAASKSGEHQSSFTPDKTVPERGNTTPAANGAPRIMSLAGLPAAGGIVWGNPEGPTVTVFSDFRCGYCRALSQTLEAMKVRVIERPISILGSRTLANQVFCAHDRARAIKAAYAGTAIEPAKPCDTSALDANERFAQEQAIAGTPVLVRSDGAVIEGYRPRAFLETWIKGGQS
jgi:thiol:disulfide interchange protein DsbC